MKKIEMEKAWEIYLFDEDGECYDQFTIWARTETQAKIKASKIDRVDAFRCFDWSVQKLNKEILW